MWTKFEQGTGQLSAYEEAYWEYHLWGVRRIVHQRKVVEQFSLTEIRSRLGNQLTSVRRFRLFLAYPIV